MDNYIKALRLDAADSQNNHDKNIRADERRKTIEEVKERFQNEISFTRIQKQLMIYILDKMKGEAE